jgi:hypothetical protein
MMADNYQIVINCLNVMSCHVRNSLDYECRRSWIPTKRNQWPQITKVLELLHEKFPPMKGKTSLWPPLTKSSSSTSRVHPECDADEPKQRRKKWKTKM